MNRLQRELFRCYLPPQVPKPSNTRLSLSSHDLVPWPNRKLCALAGPQKGLRCSEFLRWFLKISVNLIASLCKGSQFCEKSIARVDSFCLESLSLLFFSLSPHLWIKRTLENFANDGVGRLGLVENTSFQIHNLGSMLKTSQGRPFYCLSLWRTEFSTTYQHGMSVMESIESIYPREERRERMRTRRRGKTSVLLWAPKAIKGQKGERRENTTS